MLGLYATAAIAILGVGLGLLLAHLGVPLLERRRQARESKIVPKAG